MEQKQSLFHQYRALVYYKEAWDEDQKDYRRMTVAGVVEEVESAGLILKIGLTIFNPNDGYNKVIGREEATRRAINQPILMLQIKNRKGLIHNFVQVANAVTQLTNKICYQQESAE